MADDALLDTLAEIRRRGSIGEASLPAAVEHARRFVARLPPVPSRIVDLGSGGGLPGLVIAVDRPDCTVDLTERRGARADQLRRAVSALGLCTVVVHETDVALLADDPRWNAAADVVTARSFGPPEMVARYAGVLLRPGGTLLVSEPPGRPDRWSGAASRHALRDLGEADGIRVLRSAEVSTWSSPD